MATGHLKAEQPCKSYSIFLLGKAGSGKSRTGNSILGNPTAFEFGTPTNDCMEKTIEHKKSGKTIHVIDTPSDASADHNIKKIQEKINQYKNHSIPIFIFCIQIGRITESAYENYNSLSDCEYNNSIVIFTSFDKWENDMKDSQVENPDFKIYLSSLSHRNATLVHICGRLWVPFNNRLKGEKNENQVNDLLETIDNKLNTVCQSTPKKIMSFCFGPKDLELCGAVPSTRKPKQIKEDQNQNIGVLKGVAKFSKNCILLE